MNKSIRHLTVAILALTAASLRTIAEEELKGRDIVTKGTIQSISGTLKEDDHEWHVVTTNSVYTLHLGPQGYRDSKQFTLTEGEKAKIRGFVFNQHVSPISIQTESASLDMRTEKGKPLWADTSFSSQRSQKME